jgi:hypothetical protein
MTCHDVREFARRGKRKQLDFGCAELHFGYMTSDRQSGG